MCVGGGSRQYYGKGENRMYYKAPSITNVAEVHTHFARRYSYQLLGSKLTG